MELRIHDPEALLNPWIEEFILTSVRFAVWPREGQVNWIEVGIQGEGVTEPNALAHCRIRVETRHGRHLYAAYSATGPCEAVEGASRRLEDLFRLPARLARPSHRAPLAA